MKPPANSFDMVLQVNSLVKVVHIITFKALIPFSEVMFVIDGNDLTYSFITNRYK